MNMTRPHPLNYSAHNNRCSSHGNDKVNAKMTDFPPKTYFSFRFDVPNKHFLAIHGECLLGMYL